MEAADLKAALGRSDYNNKRSDPEKTPGEVDDSGDAKRLRDGEHSGATKMDMDGDDEEDEDMTPYGPFGIYLKNWILIYGHRFKFEDPTELPPMRYTYGPVLPLFGRPIDAMEIYYVKVVQITGKLQWPLDVYGDVAVRDSVDRKRNYLFRRSRERCQTLTSPQDSLLELSGPSRAVYLIDEPDFEIYLRVKAKEESEDTVLCCHVFGYDVINYKGNESYATTEVVSREHGTVEVKYGHLMCALEATIMCRITSGSGNFCARFTAHTASIGEEVVLLDTRGREVSVTSDGEVVLQRRVVVVEEQGKLFLGIKSAQLGDNAESASTLVERKIRFRARSALRNEYYFDIGSTRVQMIIAWSVLH